MIHALIASAWCLACVLAGLPWPFLFWPAAFYLGREFAQSEERYMRARNLNREKAPWWMGFHPSAWTLKGILDWLLPLAVALAAWLAQAFLQS